MNIKKVSLGLLIATFFILIAGKATFASEGQIELRSTTGSQAQCYVLSGYLPGEAQYNILVICRNLIYPVSPEALRYVVWMTPTDGTAPKRLGDLALGKVTYKTNIPFSNMFVTQEKNTNINAPTGPTVMRGNVRPIPFLEGTSQPQPDSSAEPILSPSPTPAPRSNVLSFLRSGAVITVISIFLILLMLILVKPFK